jgi:ABC-type branched-subunit amino acid transport system ATPase component
MLTYLKIERFRGIASLTLEDLARINIFVGGNGAGKSSVLEAVCLAANPTDPALSTKLAAWRELPPPTSANDDAISSFFYQGDVSHGPSFEFTADGDGTTQRLTISNLRETNRISLPISPTDSSLAQGADRPTVRGLILRYSQKPGEEYVSRLILVPGGSQARLGPRRGLGCFFIHGRRATSVAEMANLLTDLSKNNQVDEFLQSLRRFDSRILTIEPGVRGATATVLVDLSLPTKLPINVLGDGFCRMSLMVTGAFYANPRVLAIDEIDSGLHVSIMAPFWKSFAELVERKGKQVFCTTHNEEMLAHTLDAFADCQDLLRIFRIDRLDDGAVRATKYTYDAYRKSESLGWDVR